MTVDKPETNLTPAAEADETKDASKPAVRGRKTKAESEPESAPLAVAHTSSGLHLLQQPSMLPNNRPIEASHLHIVSTYKSMGGTRPVGASGIEMSGTMAISGNRPIALSHLNVSETYSVMGNRPVASNEVDAPNLLMGYLD